VALQFQQRLNQFARLRRNSRIGGTIKRIDQLLDPP
jgi:hypothetical protein